MPPFITGLLFGLVFIFSLGPGFFSLLQTSVQKGFVKAIFLAFGISLSDILYVTLALMGVANLLEEPQTKMWLAIGGTVVLIAYGIYSWFKKPRIYVSDGYEGDFSYLKYLLKGFVLNGFNPFIVVFWVGIIGIISVNYDFSFIERVYFFSGVLSTILASDITKAFIAYRLRNSITPRKILIMNRSVSVILIFFGLQMIYFLVDNYVLS